MIDRQKIFCQGGEILSKVLKAISASGIRVHGIEESSGDAWYFGYSIRHATSIGYDSGPEFFENHGYQKVDPYTFAFTWLGYIPESLKARAKGKVFCKGSPEFEPIITAIRKSEGWGPLSLCKGRDPKFEFSECTLGSGTGIAYNEGPYFGERFGRVEVSPEVFAAIWLGIKTTADVKHTDTPNPSRMPITVTVTNLQIKL